MHPCPGNWVVNGRAVVYYDRAAQAFSAGIKCRHCNTYMHYQMNVRFKSGPLPAKTGSNRRAMFSLSLLRRIVEITRFT